MTVSIYDGFGEFSAFQFHKARIHQETLFKSGHEIAASCLARILQIGSVSVVERDEIQIGRNDDTGKRGAVRNNSGESVAYSDPGLRVGPTTLSTSDRTSEACPPNSVNTGFGFDVGVNSF